MVAEEQPRGMEQRMSAKMEQAATLSVERDGTSVTRSHRRISFLDAVRGLAALAVVVQHYGTSDYFQPGAALHLDLGQVGVVAFFLVSGFIIPVSMEKYQTLGPFWKARVFRLYPMYWVSLALALALDWLHRLPVESAFFRHPVLTAAANATMLQRFMGQPDAEGVYWTLALEIIFYVLCSALVWWGWLRRAVPVAFAAAVGVLLVDNGMAYGLHRSPPAMHFCLVLTAFVGSVVYRVYQGEASGAALSALLLVVFAVAAEGFWLHYVVLPEPGKEVVDVGVWLTSWAVGYALFFACFALRAYEFPRWMQWLGQISYSLYLLHIAVWPLVPNVLPRWPQIAMVTAVAVGISYVTYRFVERPAMRLGRG